MHALFKDDDHFEEAVTCYPKDWKEDGGDEQYVFEEEVLTRAIPSNIGSMAVSRNPSPR